jgi:hypothetical protein
VNTNSAENWNLILRLCDLAKDDAITSVRVALLNEFNKPEPCRAENQLRHIFGSFKPFFSGSTDAHLLGKPKTNLPLILFPYASGSNLLNLLPVAQEAKRRGLLGLIISGNEISPEHFKDFENVITEQTLWRMVRKTGLLRIFRSARKKFKKLAALLEQLDPQCANRVRQNYGGFFRQLIVSEAMRGSFRTLLADWKPSCVISTSDYWPFEFQLFCEAKRMGIPTAIIQHGELTSVTYWPAYADTLLIWGMGFQQKLQSLGAPANRLRICGMPAADALFNRFQNQSPKAANSAAPVCLVFSHTHDRSEEPATFAAYARFLQEVISLLPRVQWRIRLHPAEDDSFYRELGLAGHSRVQIQPRNISLDDAVAEADVVCTIRSTAGLQAMMMRRPLIVLDLTPGDECSVWWPLHGGGLAVKNPETFKTVFDQLVDSPVFRDSLLKSQQEFLDKSFANKGNAAAAIVDYLEEQTLKCSKTQHSAALAKNISPNE